MVFFCLSSDWYAYYQMLLVGHTVYMIMKNYYSILHLFTFHHHIISCLQSDRISIHPSLAIRSNTILIYWGHWCASPVSLSSGTHFHFQYVHTRYPQSRLAHRNPCDIHDSALFVSVIVPAVLSIQDNYAARQCLDLAVSNFNVIAGCAHISKLYMK